MHCGLRKIFFSYFLLVEPLISTGMISSFFGSVKPVLIKPWSDLEVRFQCHRSSLQYYWHSLSSFAVRTQNQRMRYCVLYLPLYIYCFVFGSLATKMGFLTQTTLRPSSSLLLAVVSSTLHYIWASPPFLACLVMASQIWFMCWICYSSTACCFFFPHR